MRRPGCGAPALLPGDEEVQLRRVPAAAGPDVRSALWLLTHNDLRRTARIRTVMDLLATALGPERVLLEGMTIRKGSAGALWCGRWRPQSEITLPAD